VLLSLCVHTAKEFCYMCDYVCDSLALTIKIFIHVHAKPRSLYYLYYSDIALDCDLGLQSAQDRFLGSWFLTLGPGLLVLKDRSRIFVHA
jgi:hypothetical protein